MTDAKLYALVHRPEGSFMEALPVLGAWVKREDYEAVEEARDNWAEMNQAASKLMRDALEREAYLRKALQEMLECIEDRNRHLSGEWINTVCCECRELAHGALERKAGE